MIHRLTIPKHHFPEGSGLLVYLSNMKYGIYLVCREHLNDVNKFLSQFFTPIINEYTHEGWRVFSVPNADFLINIMHGDDQNLTQNMTLEIYLDSLETLKEFSQQHNVILKSFETSKSPTKYKYHFIEIPGPQNICKVEASYSEVLY